MSLTAPSITRTISASAYESQINANFAAIDDFCAAAASEVNATTGTTALGNMEWLIHALGSSGIVGTDAFPLDFDTDNETVLIMHGSNGSACVIGGRVHVSTTNSSTDIAALVTSNGAYRIAVGVQSLGAPSCSIIVVQSNNTTEDTAAGIDLLLYTFTLTRSTGPIYVVTSIQRQATCLPSAYTFDALVDQTFPIAMYLPNALPASTGNINLGFLVPFACEIIGAYGRLNVCPGSSASTSVSLRVSGTNVMAPYAFSWTNGLDGTIRTITADEPYTQLAAGSYVQVYQSVAAGDWSSASGLAITAKLRRLWVDRYV